MLALQIRKTALVHRAQKLRSSSQFFNKHDSQALKVLKTSEFTPFVVFIAAPELETLRAMHKAVVDAGITTKLLTVSHSYVCTRFMFSIK